MKTSNFDAVLDFSLSMKNQMCNMLMLFKGKRIPASIFPYEMTQKDGLSLCFVFIQTALPLSIKWSDRFKVQNPKDQEVLGEGRVLNPFSKRPHPKKIKRRIAFLQQLSGSEEEILLALAQEKGISGLWLGELMDFLPINKDELLNFSQKLEAEGKLRILSFSPLFLLSQSSFDFLCQKILSFLAKFHEDNPSEFGPSVEGVQKKFNLHPRIFSLAQKYLSREGEIRELESRLALSDFKPSVSPEEEKLLGKLEEASLLQEFRSASLEDLQKRFGLSSRKLEAMFLLLIERKKIVQGKDGFFLHSRWLEDIISKLRDSGRKELSVSDFKAMTGLTRKYAIPLLELLDQLGVTRRKGSVREILM